MSQEKQIKEQPANTYPVITRRELLEVLGFSSLALGVGFTSCSSGKKPSPRPIGSPTEAIVKESLSAPAQNPPASLEEAAARLKKIFPVPTTSFDRGTKGSTRLLEDFSAPAVSGGQVVIKSQLYYAPANASGERKSFATRQYVMRKEGNQWVFENRIVAHEMEEFKGQVTFSGKVAWIANGIRFDGASNIVTDGNKSLSGGASVVHVVAPDGLLIRHEAPRIEGVSPRTGASSAGTGKPAGFEVMDITLASSQPTMLCTYEF